MADPRQTGKKQASLIFIKERVLRKGFSVLPTLRVLCRIPLPCWDTARLLFIYITKKRFAFFGAGSFSCQRLHAGLLSLNAAMALSCYVFINVLSSGGSREGARGSHRSPLILTKKEEITEGKHPPAQSLDPPLLSTCLCNITEGAAINLPCQMKI